MTQGVTRYDAFGNSEEVKQPEGIVTTSTYDARSRVEDVTDTFGHHTHYEYDGLDRVTSKQRFNTKGNGPGLVETTEYYTGGQVRRIRTGPVDGEQLERAFTLDEMDRVVKVTETGGGLPGPLVTEYGYDAAGNRTFEKDRRGVASSTEYDLADRAVLKRIQSETPVGRDGVIARWEYDANGTLVAETDLHGFRTEKILDPLYRVVRVKHPPVPDGSI